MKIAMIFFVNPWNPKLIRKHQTTSAVHLTRARFHYNKMKVELMAHEKNTSVHILLSP